MNGCHSCGSVPRTAGCGQLHSNEDWTPSQSIFSARYNRSVYNSYSLRIISPFIIYSVMCESIVGFGSSFLPQCGCCVTLSQCICVQRVVRRIVRMHRFLYSRPHGLKLYRIDDYLYISQAGWCLYQM